MRSRDEGSAAIGLKNELANKAGKADRALRAVFRNSPGQIELSALNARAFVHMARERYSRLLAESENARDAVARSNKAKTTSLDLRRLMYEGEKPSIDDVIDAFSMEITMPDLRDEMLMKAMRDFVSQLARLSDAAPGVRAVVLEAASVALGIYLSALGVQMVIEHKKVVEGDDAYLEGMGVEGARRESMKSTIKTIANVASVITNQEEYTYIAKLLIGEVIPGSYVGQPSLGGLSADSVRVLLYPAMVEAILRLLSKGNKPEPLRLLKLLSTPFEEDEAVARDDRAARAMLDAIDKNELRIIQVAEALDAILLPGLSARPRDDMDLHQMCEDFISQCGAETDKIGDVVSLYSVNGGLSQSGRAIARYGRVYDLAEQTRITVNDVNVRKLEAQTLNQNVRSKLFSNVEALNKCANAGLDPIVLSNTFKTPLSVVASRLYGLWVNSPASIDSRELSNSLSFDDLESRLLDSDDGPLDPALYSNDRVDTYNMSLASAMDAIKHLPIISYDDARDLVDLLAGRVMMRVVRLDRNAKERDGEDQESVKSADSS